MKIDWQQLSAPAWTAREHARILGRTAVGAAVLSDSGRAYAGCNIEHRFRSHDIHAEVGALSAMVAAGQGSAIAVLVVAERDQFTPCGACLDWIFELGGPDCQVGFQARIGGKIEVFSAMALMPHYPR